MEFGAYLEHSGRSAATVKTYEDKVSAFRVWLGDRPFAVESVKAYQDYLVDRYSSSGVIQRMAAIRAYGQWQVDEGKIEFNPAASVKSVRVAKQQHAPDVLTKAELQAFCMAVRTGGNLRDIAIIETMLRTGVRIGELVNLRWRDIDFERQTVVVRRGKGGKTRKIAPDPELFRLLTAWKNYAQGETVFPVVADTVAKMMKRYAKAAGVEKNVHPHLFRHQFATELLRYQGADLVTVASVLGHSSVNTTMVYTMPTEEEQRAKMRGMYD
jgi:integrase/recombinase XerD